ncbi:MAG TPA: response regulator transcription factor, partial [Nocardioides sp.]|nr:response regulator transcription factor [Nocardioides sp.]
VIDAFVSTADTVRTEAGRRVAGLTPRELEVLGLLARGLTNQEVSRRLFVSEATTKTHVSNILAKLQITDRVQAVIVAYEAGLVRPGAPGPPHD